MNRVSTLSSPLAGLLSITALLLLGGCSAGQVSKNSKGTDAPSVDDGDSADGVASDDGSGKTDSTTVSDGIEIGCSGTKSSGVRLAKIDILAPAKEPPVDETPVCTAQDATITTVDYAEDEPRPKCGAPVLARWDGTKCEIVYQPGGDAKKVRCTGGDCSALFSGEFGASAEDTLAACEDAFAACE